MANVIFKILILYCFPLLAIAAQTFDLGYVAQNIMGPVSYLADFVTDACFLLGGSFLFASIIKYVEHRRSPLMVPISTVVFLIIAGIFLILLPFAYLLTEHGVPFSLMK